MGSKIHGREHGVVQVNPDLWICLDCGQTASNKQGFRVDCEMPTRGAGWGSRVLDYDGLIHSFRQALKKAV